MASFRRFSTLVYRWLTSRTFLLVLGSFVCLYGLWILIYVQFVPDLGLRSVFSTKIQGVPKLYIEGEIPRLGDRVTRVGDREIRGWADLLQAPSHLQGQIGDKLPPWLERRRVNDEDIFVAKVWFQGERDGVSTDFFAWCQLGNLPVEELVPSVLWFLLKLMLLGVGALVLLKRPNDKAATPFFLLCVVTLGAYMGGYHWAHIATHPPLLLIFMVCAVLLPVTSLHFYLVFPRKKEVLIRHPRWTMAAMYGVPLAILTTLVVLYLRLRWHVQRGLAPEEPYNSLRIVIFASLVVSALWYLASVLALLHSYRTAADQTELNQVKWILLGATLALVPIGYSLFLALLDPEAFSAGAATWPMFAASVFLTVAFAISITRYRLMELDKIITSGAGYFFISFLAGLAYYAIVFIGWFIFNASPTFSEALIVTSTALVVMVALDLARSRLKKVLDRRFSREKSQLDRTLQRLGQAVEQLVDPLAVAQRFLQGTADLLGAARGAIFLRQGDPPLYRLAGCLGSPPALDELALGCPVIEAVHQGKILQARPRPAAYPTPAQRQLQLLGGDIAQPLTHENRLLALLILGPKDRPYRPEDLELLAAFAQITVLALDSAEGHRTIEQLNDELKGKVEKIAEQQRRILALQSQLRRQTVPDETAAISATGKPETASADPGAGGILGGSSAVRQLLHQVRKVAATDAVVLIRGESGVGKELLARAVHENSGRAAKNYVKVHCAALAPNLLESELFGHVKGAFTGAHRDKVGRFELANGGTLFLDEIGDISLDVQTKLLRVLQEKTLERVGSSDPIQVDVRIVTATHQNLDELIRQGRFREDLFYRLNVFPLDVPPLRERIEDIPELALFFMRQSAHRCKKDVTQIDDDVLALLKGYPWPGNIRQLENIMERAVVITDGATLTLDEMASELFHAEPIPRRPSHLIEPKTEPSLRPLNTWRSERERTEREQLVRALAAADGNKAEAARALGIARSTLVSKLKKLGLS